MMHIKKSLTGLAGLILLAAIPAGAVVKIAKFTGTVSTGYDTIGVFGTPHTNLAGAAYVAVYTYDAARGGYRTTDGVTFDQSLGGPMYENDSPVMKATITINGVTQTLTGTAYGVLYTSTFPSVDHMVIDSYWDGGLGVASYIENHAYPNGAPRSLDQNFGPVASNVLPGNQPYYLYNSPYGAAEWTVYDRYNGTFVYNAAAYFGNDVVYSVSSIPEPASWVLMIAGFGMIGGAMRRESYILAV